MSPLINQDPEICNVIEVESNRQQSNINLIASENYTSDAVLEAQGSVLTNKYAEGYPGRRYYGGCQFVDIAETLAIDRAKSLFHAEHANVQPHSGSQANMAAYFSLLNPGDKVMGMSLAHGGHLTHGSPVNFSSNLYDFVSYGVNRESERIDYSQVEQLAIANRPKLIVAGASAYTRIIDFPRLREIADGIGAILLVDMAHIAGLVATSEHPSPLPHAHVITSTTHKTLRGPRGGFILSTSSLARSLDRAVFPHIQGGPMMHAIAAKAVAFKEAMDPKFSAYQHCIKMNAQVLADELQNGGLRLVSGGTDNHMVLVDLTPLGITGRDAENALENVNIVVNRNSIPYDTRSPKTTSGMRLGTPAITSRGFSIHETRIVAKLILKTLTNIGDKSTARDVRNKTLSLVQEFPIPGIGNTKI